MFKKTGVEDARRRQRYFKILEWQSFSEVILSKRGKERRFCKYSFAKYI